MAYIAGKRLKIGGEFREPGDPVPEAAEWKNLKTKISAGLIIVASNGVNEEKAKEQVKPKAVIKKPESKPKEDPKKKNFEDKDKTTPQAAKAKPKKKASIFRKKKEG